jgi:hypothetical protein
MAIKTVEIINTITMDSVFEMATQSANCIQALLQNNATILEERNIAYIGACASIKLAVRTTEIMQKRKRREIMELTSKYTIKL